MKGLDYFNPATWKSRWSEVKKSSFWTKRNLDMAIQLFLGSAVTLFSLGFYYKEFVVLTIPSFIFCGLAILLIESKEN